MKRRVWGQIMKRRVEGPRRWRVAVQASIACLGTVGAVLALQGSADAAPIKAFGVVFCTPGQSCSPGNPPVLAPAGPTGTTQTPAPITAVITNETAKGIGPRIRAVGLRAPSGVTIVSASIGGTAIVACTAKTPWWISCFTGSVLLVHGIDISPGGSIDVSIGIDTPPLGTCTTTVPCNWRVSAEQLDLFGFLWNDFTLDSASSQLGIVTTSEATCTSGTASNTCSATLANGGSTGSSGGSIGFTTSATGTGGGTFFQSINYGPPIPASDCSGVTSMNDAYVSGSALTGANARPFTVTINTTDYPGYQPLFCITTSKPFTAEVPNTTDPDDNPPDNDGDEWLLVPAVPVTQPDGTAGYAGLLPPCDDVTPATNEPTVDPATNPCVLSLSTTGNVHTIVASFPAGFDASMRN